MLCPATDAKSACRNENADSTWLVPMALSVSHCCRVRDASAKGRMPRGETSHNAKLTEQDVRDIRTQRDQGVSAAELAKRYGVVFAHILRIERRERWAHVA